MKKYRFALIVWFFIVVSSVVMVKVAYRPREPVEMLTERALSDKVMGIFDVKTQALVGSKIDLEGKKIKTDELREQKIQDEIRAQIADIPFYRKLYQYGSISVTGSICFALIVAASGFATAHILRATVFIAKIHGAEIPIKRSQLPEMTPVLNALTIAEQLDANAETASLAIDLYAKISSAATAQIAALQKHQVMLTATALPTALPDVLTTPNTQTFAELLRSEQIAPGKPLILGFHHGVPEHCDIKNLKSVAIAGWQGSGKTSSAAYLLGTSVLCYNAEAYIIDPHKTHEEGLYARIQPLEATGQIHIINPFETPGLIKTINTRLDRRLRGVESCQRPLLFVIDELARLAKMEYFDELVMLLERCTEETRKANIVFLGISVKWTARHFKGRADIRGCMNSSLIHKCKPSQAELLLEDSKEKKLVEDLKRPGDAILLTDYAGTKQIHIPFCTRTDMETVANLVGKNRHPIIVEKHLETPPATMPETPVETAETPATPFGAMVRQRLIKIRLGDKTASQNKLAEAVGLSKKEMSEMLNGKMAVSETMKNKMMAILNAWQKQGNTPQKQAETDQETTTLLLPEVRI